MDKQKNLILDQRTWDELETLIADRGLSASALIRQLIHEEYDRYLERLARRRELAGKAGP
jgi:predicted DNA-binding ribbon-helix-helix protein